MDDQTTRAEIDALIKVESDRIRESIFEIATAIYYVPAPPGAERENNLTWAEAKWYARTAINTMKEL